MQGKDFLLRNTIYKFV